MGNQSQIGGYTFGYDPENRMTSFSLNGAGDTYTYDGDGRRVTKTNGAVTIVFVYDAQGQMAARYSTTVQGGLCGTCYLTLDHLGSTRMVTNEIGVVVGLHDYLPFGEELVAGTGARGALYGAGDGVNQKFTGQFRDPGTGLDFFGARYYSGAQGRFTSPDWSARPQPVPYANLRNPQSLNLYAYVGNNPLSIRDADGHGWWGDFWNGIADSTYRPLVQFVEHPIATAKNLGSVVTHPIATARAIKNGVVTTTFSALQGNGAAIGTAVGTIGMAFIPVAGEVADGAEAAVDLSRVGEVANSAKALASDLQMQEVLSGAGTPLAGAGTGTALRDSARLAASYGGQEADWVKVASSHVTPPGGAGGFEKAGYNGGFEVHAYQNVKTGQVVELKTKFQ